MPANTTYNPQSTDQFSKDFLNFDGKSASLVCNESDTQTVDLTMTDDCLLTGGALIVKNGHIDDRVSLQVIHPTFGVVNQFVTEYGIKEDQQEQFNMVLNYPAKIFAGLKLRLVFKSSSNVGERKAVINYHLHKVLS